MKTLTDIDYQRLRDFRSGLRRFQRWSEERAAEAGLSAAQHQLMLIVRGHPDPAGPTIGDIAFYLLVRHHSAVELIDRAEAIGLVRRTSDPSDHRVVRVILTAAAERKLGALTELHFEELARLAPRFRSLWEGIGESRTTPKRRSAGARTKGGGRQR